MYQVYRRKSQHMESAREIFSLIRFFSIRFDYFIILDRDCYATTRKEGIKDTIIRLEIFCMKQ